MRGLRLRYGWLLIVFACVLLLVCIRAQAAGASTERIGIYKRNPAYWQYKGKPVLLIGGTKDDNLFQIPDLKEHLDLLKSVGGNYVRNTMSSRDQGNVWPFKKVNDKYDLNQWNDEYWRMFENLLKLAQERDIIVQIEVWATFDYYRENWTVNPFNPKNNINYTAEQTGLPEQVNTHPTRTENNFFWSVPAERNQKTVLKYQQRFVDKILSYSLRFGNVLYCMDNETSVTPEWGKYWSEYIKAGAKTAGVEVHTTEMWDKWDLAHPQHNATFDHPETYSFVDISQNNHQKGQTHWDNAQRQRARIADNIRPLNNVKIYGADTGRYGNDRDGMERFWRNIFGGLASARFHRPDSGLGLGEKAQANIRSMRMLTEKMDIFTCEPRNDLLSEREENEAYCLAESGKQYAVYFPDGGSVKLDVSATRGTLQVRWLDISRSTWQKPQKVSGGGMLELKTPGKGYWALLVLAGRQTAVSNDPDRFLIDGRPVAAQPSVVVPVLRRNKNLRSQVMSVPIQGTLILAVLGASSAPASDLAEPDRSNGVATAGIKATLVICGGQQMPDDVRDAFFTLAGGENARIVLIPTAHGIAEQQKPEHVIAFWKRVEFREWPKAEPQSIVCLHTLCKDKADTDEFVKPLREATGVWLLGGTQTLLSYVYRGTKVERELNALLDRGGVIGGTSAGAAIMSRVMLSSPDDALSETYHGFDLMPDAIIDMHFRQRNRLM